MIVVIGCPLGRLAEGVVAAAGMSSGVALSAAGAGRVVQLVGRVGDDPTADAVVLDLARGGVGHVALLRDPTRVTPLEPLGPEEAEIDGADDDGGLAETEDPPTTPPAAQPAPALEAADVDLGLRYLTEFAVLVVAEPVDATTIAVVAEAARWGDARLILVVPRDDPIPDGLPSDAVVFEAPDADPDGVFATLVGHFAAGLDEGAEPGEAFRASLGSDGWSDAIADP
jgi:hypothetical protein